MLREMQKEDRDIFLKMAADFYSSPAVLHDIPAEYKERTFDLIMSDSPYAKGYMICDDGVIAGYALIALTYSNEAGGMVLWLEELYVSEKFRGRGLGSSAINELCAEYKDKVSRFRLEAEEQNRGAVKLYKSMGFEPLEYLQFIKE